MASITFHPPSRKSRTLRLTWLLTIGLFAVTIENVWIDPWLKNKFPDFPSLVPEPPSALWLLTFAAIGIVCVVLMVGQVLLMRRDGVSNGSKIVAGVLVVAALLLSMVWFRVTSGLSAAPRILSSIKQFHGLRLFSSKSAHSVKLNWVASTTPNVGYNIYRLTKSTGRLEKLTPQPIYALTFTDNNVVDGETYTYFAKAVLAGVESAQSNLAPAQIPPT
jgi:hypothetical protein